MEEGKAQRGSGLRPQNTIMALLGGKPGPLAMLLPLAKS